ncbi:MAG: type II toxin-antitoxin system RelE/ParE family toxin [Acidimicrobiia bacterium]
MPCETYRVEASGEYFEEFVRLPAGHQRRVVRLLSHLKADARAPFAGVTALRGEWSGVYEFRISQSRGARRLFFTIDDAECVVVLEGIATHPTWDPGRDARGIRRL